MEYDEIYDIITEMQCDDIDKNDAIKAILNLDKLKTRDGSNIKKGTKVWEVGRNLDGLYSPTNSVKGKWTNNIINPSLCWLSYHLCLEYCNYLNQLKI